MGDAVFWTQDVIAQGIGLAVDGIIFGCIYKAYRHYSNNVKALEVRYLTNGNNELG